MQGSETLRENQKSIHGNKQSVTVFAIWAMNDKQHYHSRYIGQVWLAINHYQNLLKDYTILIGDFNKIWDYMDVVDMLQGSCWHPCQQDIEDEIVGADANESRKFNA